MYLEKKNIKKKAYSYVLLFLCFGVADKLLDLQIYLTSVLKLNFFFQIDLNDEKSIVLYRF